MSQSSKVQMPHEVGDVEASNWLMHNIHVPEEDMNIHTFLQIL